ncbi:MAG: N-acetylmuramoyl-L-alanine amidase [Helicobacteraceae bacterium]|jgi:N-acetylmuramoyl-L-alanine amidase|nr:N-acetylmuramoyl-L-alanine amidase [Helicobacteraceae bacterium]
MEKTLKFGLCFLLFALTAYAKGLTVVSYALTSDRLIVEFDQPISAKNYDTFYIKATKTDPLRRVIDIKARFNDKYFEDKTTAPTNVKIAQFNADVTRIVFAYPSQFNISVKTENKSMFIDIDAQKPKPIVSDRGYKPLVVIDAGHGGKDTGAIGLGKTEEKSITLNVALHTAKFLKERGFEVKMTREKDVYVSLQDRTAMANKVKADLFVSIHANACPLPCKLQGVETYFLSPAKNDRAKEVAALENSVVVDSMESYSKEAFLNFLNREMVVSSNKLAIDIQRAMLVSARGSFPSVDDKGVREGPFWVLVGAQMPAVLVEVGYMTHTQEIKRLTNSGYQIVIAQGIALGIENYFINNQQ